MEITILGTSSMVPTKERNVSSFFLEYKGEGMLIDCGEGTQRQMNIANINRNRVKKIFISHWHGDHVSGLIGLLQTIGNAKEVADLLIFGPRETEERIGHMLKMCFFNEKVNVHVKELNPKKMEVCHETEEYQVLCTYLEHRIPCLAYAFIEKDKWKIDKKKMEKIGLQEGPLIGKIQREGSILHKGKKVLLEDIARKEKGKKVSFVLDTVACNQAVEISKDADLLVCEATYCDDEAEKAEEHMHLTGSQAAHIAAKANVKKLVAVHFSQRYKEATTVQEEMKRIFPNSVAAHDFMKIKV